MLIIISTYCSNTPPQTKRSRVNVEFVTEKLKAMRNQRFSEDVSNLILSGVIPYIKTSSSNTISNKVEVNFDVFCKGMKGRICSEVGGSNVVTPKNRWARKEEAKFP